MMSLKHPFCSSSEILSEVRVAKELTISQKNSILEDIFVISHFKHFAALPGVFSDNDLHENIFIEWSERRNERQFVKQKCEHAPNIIHQKFTIQANNERDGMEQSVHHFRNK